MKIDENFIQIASPTTPSITVIWTVASQADSRAAAAVSCHLWVQVLHRHLPNILYLMILVWSVHVDNEVEREWK